MGEVTKPNSMTWAPDILKPSVKASAIFGLDKRASVTEGQPRIGHARFVFDVSDEGLAEIFGKLEIEVCAVKRRGCRTREKSPNSFS